MKSLFYIAIIEIVTYLVVTIAKFGIPKSISDTYYLWKKKSKFLFTFIMWLTGLPLLFYWVDIAPNAVKFLPFLSVSGMCFVGAACAFKETLTNKVHYISAGIWAGTALLYFIITNSFIPIVIGVVFAFIGFFINKYKNQTFWAEIACVIMIIVGIFLI